MRSLTGPYSDGLKGCPRCKRALPFSEFGANRRLSSGLNSWCRECHRQACRAWREQNPSRVDAYNASRRVGARVLVCVECGQEFEARSAMALVCSRKCKDRRYQRLHPEAYAAKQQRKHARRLA